MIAGRPYVLPWLPERQLHCDADRVAHLSYSYMRHPFLSTCQTSGNKNTQVSVKNRLEENWDKTIFGQLSSKIGNLAENKGDELESLDVEGDPTYVYCLRFCPEKSYRHLLALANEDGRVSIVDTSEKSCVKTEFGAHQNAIFDLAWMPGSEQKIVTVSGDMTARLWDISRTSQNIQNLANEDATSPTEELNVFRGHGRSVKCIEFRPNTPNEFATGSRENSICLWDIRDPAKAKNTIREAHVFAQSASTTLKQSASLTALSTSSHGTRISVRRTPSRRVLRRPRQGSQETVGGGALSKGSVTALQFQDDNTLISASDLDGIIKIWDPRKPYDLYSGIPKPKQSIPYGGKSALRGYSALLLDSSRTKLYASCKDHTIYTFDVGQHDKKSALRTFTGHTNGNKFFVRISLSTDDRYLISGSSDGAAYVWNTNIQGSASSQIATLKGHEAEVTCVDFSKDTSEVKLATCSDDFKCKVWRTGSSYKCGLYLHPEPEVAALSGGEVFWNVETNPYEITQPYEDKICYDSAFKIHSGKSKRRLFCDGTGNEENRSDNSQDVESINKRLKLMKKPEDRQRLAAFPSSSPIKMTNVLVSPRKASGIPPNGIMSPRKLNITPIKNKEHLLSNARKFPTPTGNLPNIILDGRSPHDKRDAIRSQGSGKMMGVKMARKVDWLTEMSQQKKNTLPKKVIGKQQQLFSKRERISDYKVNTCPRS